MMGFTKDETYSMWPIGINSKAVHIDLFTRIILHFIKGEWFGDQERKVLAKQFRGRIYIVAEKS